MVSRVKKKLPTASTNLSVASCQTDATAVPCWFVLFAGYMGYDRCVHILKTLQCI